MIDLYTISPTHYGGQIAKNSHPNPLYQLYLLKQSYLTVNIVSSYKI